MAVDGGTTSAVAGGAAGVAADARREAHVIVAVQCECRSPLRQRDRTLRCSSIAHAAERHHIEMGTADQGAACSGTFSSRSVQRQYAYPGDAYLGELLE